MFVFLIPIIIINKKVNDYIVDRFIYVIISLIVIFIINESLKSIELVKNDFELKKLRERNKILESDFESTGLFLENLPKEFLKSVSQFLNLKNSDRISLYVLDGEKFRIIGRYSENLKYNRNGRSEYPSDCGYISKCLGNNNGKAYYFKEKLPKDPNNYVKMVSKDSGMNEKDIKNLSMRSRTYFARVIKDTQDQNVGILVLESINPTLPISADEINSKLEELSIPYMSTFLDISNKLKGDSSNE